MGVFLTCSLMVPDPFSNVYAFDNNTDSNAAYSFPDQRVETPFAESDRNRQLSLLGDYIRKQSPGWMPGAPSIVRNPSQWLQNRLNPSDADDTSGPPLIQPLSSLAPSPGLEDAEGMWFSPDYHHRGFLPINDAMIMGVNLRQRSFQNLLQFDVHPFMGQNWHSSDNYWGSEFAVSLHDGNPQPWGKVVLRYNNGDNELMDQNRGFDMHGELNFDDRLMWLP